MISLAGVISAISCVLIGGCQTTVQPSNAPPNQSLGGVAEALSPDHRIDTDENTSGAENESFPVVIVNQQPVFRSAVYESLAELAGRKVLQEHILTQLLVDRCRAEEIEITDETIDREQHLILQSLDPDPDRAVILLDQLRRRRGLGPVRYASLLKRNAMLRALVHDIVDPDEQTLRTLFKQRYGERYQIRLMTFQTHTKTEQIHKRLRNGEPFNELAALHSTDASAERGGLLEPISPVDTRYPETIRQILADVAVNEISPILTIDTGYCFFQMVELIPPSEITFDRVRDDLERTARLYEERVLMDSLSRELLSSANVIVMDKALGWSWENQPD